MLKVHISTIPEGTFKVRLNLWVYYDRISDSMAGVSKLFGVPKLFMGLWQYFSASGGPGSKCARAKWGDSLM